uniref:Uncharacterized protein n=1 Tax=Arundo donax TaxID=35708 RepID=A0A0A9F4W6_ARUDO
MFLFRTYVKSKKETSFFRNFKSTWCQRVLNYQQITQLLMILRLLQSVET